MRMVMMAFNMIVAMGMSEPIRPPLRGEGFCHITNPATQQPNHVFDDMVVPDK